MLLSLPARCLAIRTRQPSASKAHEAGLKPNIISGNAIISAYAEFGYKDEAAIGLSKAQEAWLKPGIISFNIVIAARAKFGDMGRAT